MLNKIFKITVCITLFLFSYKIYSNDVMLYSYNGIPQLTEVVNNELINIKPVEGKTYSLTNGLSFDTTTNCLYAIYTFPMKIAIAQMQDTQTYFSEFDIEYKNNPEVPELVNINKSDFIFSFIGSIYCKSLSTKTNIINTKLANILFSEATLFVRSDPKYTHIYVINGTATVIDSKSTKKQKELKEGDYLVVTPKINLSNGKGMAINTSSGNSFSMREIEDDENSSFNEFDKILQRCLDKSLFININSSIIGIKVN